MECRKYVTSSSLHKDDAIALHLICIRSIEVVLNLKMDDYTRDDSVITLHAVYFPSAQSQLPSEFWRLVGTGISSRLAEYCVKHIRVLQDVTGTLRDPQPISRWCDQNHRKICQRIVDLVNRAPIGGNSREVLARDDVYLFQTGMSAIYHTQALLNRCLSGQSVMFGFPYELTLKLLETYGPPVKFYPFGSDEELAQLEKFLAAARQEGQPVQAIWCECASNPLLRTPDLCKIRALADKQQVAIVVDDTIGSFANVDLMHVADIIVTSLTKSFSGFADVMGGRSVLFCSPPSYVVDPRSGLLTYPSLVLNPASPLYPVLKKSLDATYTNRLFERDTAQLEKNSRDFLYRASRLNDTASYIVRSLQIFVSDPASILTALYYPEICWSTANYRAQMHQPTKEFTPGFGGLFTMEFEDVELASIFFNALNVHKGPSLGAHITLAQPYVQTVFYKQKAWAANFGLHESIVRVSVGLEDKEALLAAFKDALGEANKKKRSRDPNGYEHMERYAPVVEASLTRAQEQARL